MKGAMLIAMTSLLAAQLVSPGMAQKYSWGGVETSRHDSLLPPRVERVGVRASLLYWGMPSADVERIMGTSAELQTYDGPGGNVRVLSYPTEPLPSFLSATDRYPVSDLTSPVSTSAGCPRTAEQCG
jgi:hypothetical protein